MTIKPNRLPLTKFFTQYQSIGFHYNPSESQSAAADFQRLRLFLKQRNEREQLADYRKTRQAYEDALTKQFNHVYGRRIDDYTAWHTLCTRISVKHIPSTIEECKKIVKRTHVNLVDLTQATKPHSRVQVFRSEEELRKYTMSTEKYFPRRNVHAGDVLKYLLRKILVFKVDNDS